VRWGSMIEDEVSLFNVKILRCGPGGKGERSGQTSNRAGRRNPTVLAQASRLWPRSGGL
jgi:hypothetical protein